MQGERPAQVERTTDFDVNDLDFMVANIKNHEKGSQFRLHSEPTNPGTPSIKSTINELVFPNSITEYISHESCAGYARSKCTVLRNGGIGSLHGIIVPPCIANASDLDRIYLSIGGTSISNIPVDLMVKSGFMKHVGNTYTWNEENPYMHDFRTTIEINGVTEEHYGIPLLALDYHEVWCTSLFKPKQTTTTTTTPTPSPSPSTQQTTTPPIQQTITSNQQLTPYTLPPPIPTIINMIKYVHLSKQAETKLLENVSMVHRIVDDEINRFNLNNGHHIANVATTIVKFDDERDYFGATGRNINAFIKLLDTVLHKDAYVVAHHVTGFFVETNNDTLSEFSIEHNGSKNVLKPHQIAQTIYWIPIVPSDGPCSNETVVRQQDTEISIGYVTKKMNPVTVYVVAKRNVIFEQGYCVN